MPPTPYYRELCTLLVQAVFFCIVARGTDVVITIRGKRVARLVPYAESSTAGAVADNAAESAEYGPTDEIFGLWADSTETADVAEYLRKLRKGRQF